MFRHPAKGTMTRPNHLVHINIGWNPRPGSSRYLDGGTTEQSRCINRGSVAPLRAGPRGGADPRWYRKRQVNQANSG